MLANDITLDKKDGTDVIFRLTSQGVDGSKRLDITSTMALPTALVIKHSTTGKLPLLVDRHLVQVTKTVSASVGTASVNANFTLTVPRDVAITPTVIYDVITHILDLLQDGSITGLATTANIDAILRGES